MLSSGNDIAIAYINSHQLLLPRSDLHKIKPGKNHIMGWGCTTMVSLSAEELLQTDNDVRVTFL